MKNLYSQTQMEQSPRKLKRTLHHSHIKMTPHEIMRELGIISCLLQENWFIDIMRLKPFSLEQCWWYLHRSVGWFVGKQNGGGAVKSDECETMAGVVWRGYRPEHDVKSAPWPNNG